MDSRGVLELIREASTLADMREFLKSRGLRHSAQNWDTLIEDRVLPEIGRKRIKKAELVDYLSEAEEYGRQHVFLYKTSGKRARQIIDKDRIRRVLASKNLIKLLDAPNVLDKPKKTQITCVRWDDSNSNDSLIIKTTETHEFGKLVGESTVGSTLTKTYEIIQERSVD